MKSNKDKLLLALVKEVEELKAENTNLKNLVEELQDTIQMLRTDLSLQNGYNPDDY